MSSPMVDDDVPPARTRRRAGTIGAEMKINAPTVQPAAKPRNTRGGIDPATAAGPYIVEYEDMPIAWYANKHPAPWMRAVWMTPEIARYLLNNHNTDNRPILPSNVDYKMRLILSNQWHFTHQGMAMDSNGVLQDGQHGLAAIDALGKDNPDLKVPVPFWVGMPPENFAAVDDLLLRTAAQMFGRNKEKHGPAMQAGIRLVLAYRDGNPRLRHRLKASIQTILGEFDTDPDRYRAAGGFAKNAGKIGTGPGVAFALHYLLHKANDVDGENRFVNAFLDGLVTGCKAGTRTLLDDDDPRNVIRETFAGYTIAPTRNRRFRKPGGVDQLSMLLLTWNNIVNGVRPRVLKYAEGSPVPRIVICQDTGDKASACPEALRGEVDGDDA